MSRIVDFAFLQIGKPYKYGRSGPDSFDCSGLIKRAAALIGLDLYHGATTQWTRGQDEGQADQYGYFKEIGLIADLPMDKVALLYNQDRTRTDKLVMAHTALYNGLGIVVQAGGYGGSGVHYNLIDKRRFSHYALLSDFWTGRDESIMTNVNIRRGDMGEAVKKMQLALIALGYNVGLNTLADGKFGPATEAAVRKFQLDFKLPVTGEWGPAEGLIITDLEDNVEPPVNDDDPSVLIPLSLIKDLEDLTNKLISFRR